MTIQGSGFDWRARVVSTAVALPPRILVYAPPGTGKTTLAASAPRALIIDFDRGADQTSAARIAGPSSWSDSLSLIRSISSDAHDYATLVIDTLDPLEELARLFPDWSFDKVTKITCVSWSIACCFCCERASRSRISRLIRSRSS